MQTGVIVTIALLGTIGGIGNIFLFERTINFPRRVHTETKDSMDPGFLANLFLGALAAVITYSLSGAPAVGLAQIANALLTGVGGASVLTSMLQRRDIKNYKVQRAVMANTISKSSGPRGRS